MAVRGRQLPVVNSSSRRRAGCQHREHAPASSRLPYDTQPPPQVRRLQSGPTDILVLPGPTSLRSCTKHPNHTTPSPEAAEVTLHAREVKHAYSVVKAARHKPGARRVNIQTGHSPALALQATPAHQHHIQPAPAVPCRAPSASVAGIQSASWCRCPPAARVQACQLPTEHCPQSRLAGRWALERRRTKTNQPTNQPTRCPSALGL